MGPAADCIVDKCVNGGDAEGDIREMSFIIETNMDTDAVTV
jgi:hypothetical protein